MRKCARARLTSRLWLSEPAPRVRCAVQIYTWIGDVAITMLYSAPSQPEDFAKHGKKAFLVS